MEQVIVILVFAFCAAVCVGVFVNSYLITAESKDKTNALIAMESWAESYKAFSGDLVKTADALGAAHPDKEDALIVYYDKKWRMCDENEAVYCLKIIKKGLTLPILCDIITTKKSGEEIVSFTVAARGGETR